MNKIVGLILILSLIMVGCKKDDECGCYIIGETIDTDMEHFPSDEIVWRVNVVKEVYCTTSTECERRLFWYGQDTLNRWHTNFSYTNDIHPPNAIMKDERICN